MKDLLRFGFLASLIFIYSCAKKVGEKTEVDAPPSTVRNPTNIDPDIEQFFKAQRAGCLNECHPSVAKLVVYERGAVEYCTAVLVSEDMLATSSACLPQNLQFPNMDCVNNIFAVFPGDGALSPFKAACHKVIDASRVDAQRDPALRRGDFAFIQLKSRVPRPPAKISRLGMDTDEQLILWKMDYLDSERASLEKTSCKPLLNSYLNPFATQNDSPMIPIADCEFNEGNLGAPLFNGEGEVVGLVSAKSDDWLSGRINNSDLLTEPMAPIQHAGNFACANIPLPEEADFVPGLECLKPIDYLRLDRERWRLLYSRGHHLENMKAVKEQLKPADGIFSWTFEFHAGKEGNALESRLGAPNCFLDPSSWIDRYSRGVWRRNVYTYGSLQVELPHFRLWTKLNRYLQVVSLIERSAENDVYQVEFNPASAWFDQTTDVTVSGEFFGGATYSNITGDCSL